nr:DNA-directed DNA polymerase [Tanacetum cinerariifolium]
MLRACPHHGFTELTQIDTLYNGLNENDQDSLNVATSGNLLSKTTREALKIIENKPKVRYSRNKPNVSRMNTTFRENASKMDDKIDKLADQISTLVDIVSKKVVTPATVKAVEGSCVTCGGNHAYYNCDATNSNQSSVYAATGTYNQVAPQNSAINYMEPPVLLRCKTIIKIGMDVCHALADLGASINLMPLSIWKNISLPELTPTRMTLKLADRSITRPKGVAEDVFVNVRKFHFLTDFVVVDFEVDPRVPLILGRSFLRTGRSSIDVYGEEITLRVNDEAVTFNLNQTTRYSSTYDDMSVNQIDIIGVAREQYAQEMLGFSNNFLGDNPTSTSEPIISNSSPSLTPFKGSNFILEEIEAYLKDESISLKNDHAKSSIEEPPELELKDLPSHLEYAYLEGADKLPVIIAKDLNVDEKEALLKVLKSHKRAIAWKITNIKGIDPRFCTHKILMEEDYKPAVQSQRRVNPKIHEVIKKEVIKLLDAEMIYPISDSSWVSPIHCVHKKGGITVVEKENNEHIPTQLVTGSPSQPLIILETYGIANLALFLGYEGSGDVDGKQDAKLRLLRWVLLLQEFDIIIHDKKGTENLTADHLSRLENPHKDVFENKDINENFPLETLDFMGPFPSLRGNRYILVVVDYLSKWVEAKALPANDARVVVKFLKSLFARFGTPRAIISDRGTHFCNDKFAKVMSKYGVAHHLATTYHPHTSRQVEVLNRGLKRILKRTVGERRASWSEKLEDAL